MAEEKIALLEGDDQLKAGRAADNNPEALVDVSKRRSLVSKLLFLTLGFTLAWIALSLWSRTPVRHCHGNPAPRSIEDRVNKILTTTPLIDGHDDLPILLRFKYGNKIYGLEFRDLFVNGNLTGHVDLPRLSAGKVGGSFWSVFVPCPKDGANLSNENYAESVKQTFEQVDVISRLQQVYPHVFSEPPNGTTARQAFRDGKIISPYGIEGLHSIGNSLSHLRTFYKLGVSYATLTHNCHNIYADAALVENSTGGITKSKPLWHGISEKGKDLIFEMNRIGLIVDLSHVSQDTMRDVLGDGKDDWRGSKAPVIFSHSSAFAVCPHPRNVPDDVLQLVRKTNSVVMINFAPDFVSCTASDRTDGLPDYDPINNTLEHVVDHIVHIGELIGYEHIGLGSDFDGIQSTPVGLEDVSKYPDLIAALLRRGISDEDAAKIAGENVLRVWKKVDEVALTLQAEGAQPVEDDLKLV